MIRVEQPEISRDQWGRPRLFGRAWERASTRAGRLDDKGALISWKAKQVANAYRDRPELAAMDVEAAIELIEASDAAAYGTMVHAVIESILLGDAVPDDATEEHIADAHAALDAVELLGITPVAAELFVVNEELGCAGTMDLLGAWPDGTGVCVDWKTVGRPNSWRFSGLKWSIQTGIYATGRPLSPDGLLVDWSDLGLPTPSPVEGIVVQVHQRNATALTIATDLARGVEAAKLAAVVQRARSDKEVARLA